MRIKICGITQPAQGVAIANYGATALGLICVSSSPRYVSINQIKRITDDLSAKIDLIGVFANAEITQIQKTLKETELTGIQLHGNESPQFCENLRQQFPHIELIKAFRVKNRETLQQIPAYISYVNTILLDAYHPQQLGGTGHTINGSILEGFKSPLPWFLAGGLTPDNVADGIKELQPDGIDLSSGVERSPGDKDLQKVQKLFNILSHLSLKENNR